MFVPCPIVGLSRNLHRKNMEMETIEESDETLAVLEEDNEFPFFSVEEVVE